MTPGNSGPLVGVRALVLDGLGPTPFASMLLADMGAHVVRVSRPAHRSARSLEQNASLERDHDIAFRGCEYVEIDLKSEDGRSEVLKLVRHSDVFIEGFRPGVAERLRLGPETLHEQNPRLVYARLTGYGQNGPLAHEAGHDINYVAQSGVLGALGAAGGPPLPPINLLGDYAGGGTFAAFGIACALVEAKTSGRGQVIDSAMMDGVATLSARIQGLRAAGTHSDERGTNFLDGAAPFYTSYECAEGGFIAVGALEADFYSSFLTGLGVDTSSWPEQNDQDQWPRLRSLIGDVVATRTRAEWEAIFAGTDACVSPVLSFDEAAEHPHNMHRSLYTRLAGALHPAPAPRFSRTPARTPSVPIADPRSVHDVLEEWH